MTYNQNLILSRGLSEAKLNNNRSRKKNCICKVFRIPSKISCLCWLCINYAVLYCNVVKCLQDIKPGQTNCWNKIFSLPSTMPTPYYQNFVDKLKNFLPTKVMICSGLTTMYTTLSQPKLWYCLNEIINVS